MNEPDNEPDNLHENLPDWRGASVIVTAGTGGVGKTTVAAAIGIAQAQAGRRCVVITIDPARRLAGALGLESLGNDPVAVNLGDALGRSGGSGGSLYACMLDTKATFDGVVRREATPEQAEAILANRFYENISGSLSGTQEYMAAEKVHELATDKRFDVVVIDTPPAANAIDFLTAPRRLVRFLDHTLFRLVISPGKGPLRFVSGAAQTVLKPLTQVIGGKVVSDAIDFFRAFDGLEAGFRTRASAALDILSADSTSWVLITTSEADPLSGAVRFAEQIGRAGVSVRGVILNRCEPSFAGLPTKRPADDPLAQILEDHRAATNADDRAAEQLGLAVPNVPIRRLPRLASDVHDIAALLELASHCS
jgi:anion-transporting  ArsA/GET3 family ATPase